MSPTVRRPIPNARGYVTDADGTMRSETDEEFRAYIKECLADPERWHLVSAPVAEPESDDT